MTDSTFRDVIYSYTRAQAIEDGVLVDVSSMAAEAGFKWPVAITRTAWEHFVAVPDGIVGQDESGRLWDILNMLRFACRTAKGQEFLFQLHVRNDNRGGLPPLVSLKAVCGPGDTAEPTITVLEPDED